MTWLVLAIAFAALAVWRVGLILRAARRAAGPAWPPRPPDAR
jgi:hypothetical protein